MKNTEVLGKKIKCMDLGFINTPVERSILENGRMVNNMEELKFQK